MSKETKQQVFPVATVDFDKEKFKLRYGLTDADFSILNFPGSVAIRLAKGVVLPDNPPIFDPPDPPEPLPPDPVKLEVEALLALENKDWPSDWDKTLARIEMAKFLKS